MKNRIAAHSFKARDKMVDASSPQAQKFIKNFRITLWQQKIFRELAKMVLIVFYAIILVAMVALMAGMSEGEWQTLWLIGLVGIAGLLLKSIFQHVNKGHSASAAERRMVKVNTMADTTGCQGILVSKKGDVVCRDIYSHKYQPGEYLWFLFTWRAGKREPDGTPIIITDAACFWLNLPTELEFSLKTSSSRVGQIGFPEVIKSFVAPDGTYGEWKAAFESLENWFARESSGWSYQWSRRTDNVKRLMAGQCSDWISQIDAEKQAEIERQLLLKNNKDYLQGNCPECGNKINKELIKCFACGADLSSFE